MGKTWEILILLFVAMAALFATLQGPIGSSSTASIEFPKRQQSSYVPANAKGPFGFLAPNVDKK